MPSPSHTANNNLRGIGFILLACLSMTASAVLIKTVGKSLGSFETVLIRCCFTLLIILITNARGGLSFLKTPRPGLITLRSLILSVVILGNFYAIVHLPLVQVTALQFTKPLFLVVLAALFLEETVRIPRTLATLIGFMGILIILRPTQDIHPVQLLVLVAALGMALIAVLTKKLTKDHSSATLLFYGNLAVVIICLWPSISHWQKPELIELAFIAGLGLSAYIGQLCMIQAYRHGEVTVVTPFEYIRIIFIALAGLIIFGEVPDSWTISGAVVICASTLFIAYRQTRNKSRAAQMEK